VAPLHPARRSQECCTLLCGVIKQFDIFGAQKKPSGGKHLGFSCAVNFVQKLPFKQFTGCGSEEECSLRSPHVLHTGDSLAEEVATNTLSSGVRN